MPEARDGATLNRMIPSRPSRRQVLFLAAGCAASGSIPAIRAGCQTRAFGVPIRERDRLLSALDQIAAAGYAGFETNVATLEGHFAAPASLRGDIEGRKLSLIGPHFTPKLHKQDAVAAEREAFDRIARGAAALGGTHLIASSPGIQRLSSGQLHPGMIDLWTSELNRAGRRARGLGLRLCLHNHARELEHDADELRTVLARTDPAELSLLLDISFAHLAKMSIPSLISENAKRLAGLHIRDMNGPDQALLGEGEIDFQEIGRTLRSLGWSGWVIVEMNSRPDLASGEMVRRAREHMRKAMNI